MKTVKVNFDYPIIFPKLSFHLLEQGYQLMSLGHDKSDKEWLNLMHRKSISHDNTRLPDVSYLNTETGKWEHLVIETESNFVRINRGRGGSFFLLVNVEATWGLLNSVDQLLTINTLIMNSSNNLKMVQVNINEHLQVIS